MLMIRKRFARAIAGGPNGDERGSVLIVVIGLIVFASIVALTISSATMGALGTTTSARASVQSNAAAEAGIDVAELGLRTAGDCTTLHPGGVYSSSTAPVYTAQVSYLTAGGWVNGCPDPTATLQVKVVSTGSAIAKGNGTATSGNTAKLQALYGFAASTGGIAASGGAIWAGSTGGLNNLTVTQTSTVTPGGVTPDVVVNNGSFNCSPGTTITGSLIVKNGNVDLTGCIVLGSIRASGYVQLHSNDRVDGDVIASGIGVAAGVKVVVVEAGNTAGNVQSGGPVSIAGTVNGNVTAAGSGESIIGSATKITGSLSIAGTLSWGALWSNVTGAVTCLVGGLLTATIDLSCALKKIGTVLGGTVTGLTSLVAPPAPTAAAWPGYSYKLADWTSAGFTERKWEGSCTVDNNPTNQVFIAKIMAATTPTVVNALSCPKLLFSSSAALQLKLNANVAFVSNSFGLESLTIDSATSANLSSWFIVPGLTLPLSLSVCLDVGINVNSTVQVKAKVSVLLYAPGCINSSASTWRGQIYGGTVNFGQQVSLDYVPVGLPGVNLDGTPATPGAAAALGDRVSLRQG